jgi:hypothetical protein
MDLETAIDLIKHVVKYTGTIDQKHIDLGLVPVEERSKYEQALVIGQLAIRDGKISKDEFMRKVRLD